MLKSISVSWMGHMSCIQVALQKLNDGVKFASTESKIINYRFATVIVAIFAE